MYINQQAVMEKLIDRHYKAGVPLTELRAGINSEAVAISRFLEGVYEGKELGDRILSAYEQGLSLAQVKGLHAEQAARKATHPKPVTSTSSHGFTMVGANVAADVDQRNQEHRETLNKKAKSFYAERNKASNAK
ncbi:MAG: hypothetical protein HY348_07365 [Nitrospira defluvii]|nr:hypothetical protein [Nitrospira defluvii]